MTKKLYCYVDETGQDTQGTLFIVTVVIPKNKDALLAYLEEVEKDSGKEKFKWGKADPRKRKRYLTAILTQKKYPLMVYYSVYKRSKTYKHATILSIAKAITSIRGHDTIRFIIYVDGLSKKDQMYYGAQLHQLGIASKKVKGVRRDESNALIRLADSICGYLRDGIETNELKTDTLYQNAITHGVLIQM